MEKLYIFLIAFVCVGAVNAQRILDSTNYPKRYELKEFKLSQMPFEWNKNTHLDTNAVYIRTLDSVFVQVVGKKQKWILFAQYSNIEQIRKHQQRGLIFFNKVYIIYRYFGNGVAFSSFPYASEPSEVECNDLQYGNYTLYNFVNDNEIVEEQLTPNDINTRKTHREYFFYTITNDYMFIHGSKRKLKYKISSYMNEKGGYDYYQYKKKVQLYNFNVKPRF